MQAYSRGGTAQRSQQGLLGQSGANGVQQGHLHDLHVDCALVANGGDPTSHAIGLDLALHPHQAGLLLLPRPFPNLNNLTRLQLSGGVLRASAVQLEALREDGVLHNLEQVATLLEEDGALVSGQSDPALNVILHDLGLDTKNVHGLLLRGALQNLHHLAQLQPPQSPAVLDAHARRDHRVLRHLHEDPDGVQEPVLADGVIALVGQAGEHLRQLLLGQLLRLVVVVLLGLVILLLLSLGLLRLRQLLAPAEEGQELGLVYLAVLAGVNVSEHGLAAELVHAPVVLDHLQSLLLQRIALVALLDLCVLSEASRVARGADQAGLELGHPVLESLHLQRQPTLEVCIDPICEVCNLLLCPDRRLFGLLDGLRHLVGELDHFRRNHGLALARQRGGLLLGLVHELPSGVHLLAGLLDPLLQLGPQLGKLLLPGLPGGLALRILDPLAGDADGVLQALEALLLDALSAIFRQDLPQRIHSGILESKVELAPGILLHLVPAQGTVLVGIVLVEESLHLRLLLPRLRPLDGLLAGLPARGEGGLRAPRAPVDPLQELGEGLLGLGGRLAGQLRRLHLLALGEDEVGAGLHLLLGLLTSVVDGLGGGLDLVQLQLLVA
mmetsp:Transcript_51412/g.161599  ORF Transcript_51412/g.161599 Transcript_51412/m.161599 type:complete len:611 (-) Transcript_51412:1560-3392(-)